jgi:hypothetical protein
MSTGLMRDQLSMARRLFVTHALAPLRAASLIVTLVRVVR